MSPLAFAQIAWWMWLQMWQPAPRRENAPRADTRME